MMGVWVASASSRTASIRVVLRLYAVKWGVGLVGVW